MNTIGDSLWWTLEIGMGVSLPSRRVIRILDELVAVHGCPSAIRVDNGLSQKSTRRSFSDLACHQ